MNLRKFLQGLSAYTKYFTPEELEFYNSLLENQGELSPFTENGLKILKCMQDNQEKYINIFKAKDIGEILFMSPRSVSGSMKKLIADGYVEKVGIAPVAYGLTDMGNSCEFDS